MEPLQARLVLETSARTSLPVALCVVRAGRERVVTDDAVRADGFRWHESRALRARSISLLNRLVQYWQSWKEVLENGDFDRIRSEPDDGIRNDWWNPGWIPITQNAAGDHLCLDLAPTPEGDVGQIIPLWHDTPERTLEAVSFEEWVTAFADGLERGLYVYSKGYGGIIDAKEAKYYEK